MHSLRLRPEPLCMLRALPRTLQAATLHYPINNNSEPKKGRGHAERLQGKPKASTLPAHSTAYTTQLCNAAEIIQFLNIYRNL